MKYLNFCSCYIIVNIILKYVQEDISTTSILSLLSTEQRSKPQQLVKIHSEYGV